MKILIAVLAIALSTGCSTAYIGRDFDLDVARRLQEGKTTKSEVRSWIGEPPSRARDQKRNETWVYSYKEVRAVVTLASFFFPCYSAEIVTINGKKLKLKFTDEVLVGFTAQTKEPIDSPYVGYP